MSAPPPNILWIITTQWRAQATGYAGDPNARTPQLDALAAESITYTQAVTPHPFGPFARAALLTGVASPENGVRGYYDPLPPDARTIAHQLGERGYATAFFGKWHLYRRDPAAPPVGAMQARLVVPPEWRGGFACWEGFEGGFLLNDPWLHGNRLPVPVRFPGYQSDVVCARAAEWIRDVAPPIPKTGTVRAGAEENRRIPGRPWFCMVSLEPPHPPYDAPAADVEPRDPREIVLPSNVPRGGEVETKARRELAGYYAHLEATDRAIGRMLAQSGPENAVAVITSVHGDMHGAHGLFRKGWPHEESVRVPLLVRGIPKEGTGDGIQDSALVSLIDLPRWAGHWAQHGASALSAAASQQISMPSVVHLPHQCDRAWRGVRTASRKLVVTEDGAPWLFFDLERDAGENHNVVGEARYAAEMTQMRRWL